MVDPAWDGGMHLGYIVVTPAIDTKAGKHKGVQEWASERMARALFNGRGPKEATSTEAILSKLNRLIVEIAPGCDGKLFRGCHLATDLLKRHTNNVDLCVIAALRCYCSMVAEEGYPCDVRIWPWTDEQMEAWVIGHKAGEEKTLARAEEKSLDRAGKKTLATAEPQKTPFKEKMATGEAPAGKRAKHYDSEPSADSSGAASSKDPAPGSLFSKWAEPL